MSEYIINPMWFYWVNVLDIIKDAALVIALTGGIAGSIVFGLLTMECYCDEDWKRWKKGAKALVLIVLVFTLICIFVPSKNTMYQMMIAKYATHENVSLSVEAIKSAVDYIVEKIGAL